MVHSVWLLPGAKFHLQGAVSWDEEEGSDPNDLTVSSVPPPSTHHSHLLGWLCSGLGEPPMKSPACLFWLSLAMLSLGPTPGGHRQKCQLSMDFFSPLKEKHFFSFLFLLWLIYNVVPLSEVEQNDPLIQSSILVHPKRLDRVPLAGQQDLMAYLF